MFKFKRPRAMFEASGDQGGGSGGGDGGGQGGGAWGGAGDATELAKAQAEATRLGKLVNDYAEKDKSRQLEETKKQEENAKKQWEFEKLYSDSKTALEDITTKHTSASEQLTKYDEYFKEQFDTSIKTLSKEQKDVVEKLLDWKSNFDKATLLPSLLAQFGLKPFGKDPNGGKPPVDADKSKDLLAKWDVKWSLALKLAGK